MTHFLAAVCIYLSSLYLTRALTGRWMPLSTAIGLALGHYIGLELL